jgi:ABC-type Zn uptake system ZnuABC Zn-binding protein ZnuA
MPRWQWPFFVLVTVCASGLLILPGCGTNEDPLWNRTKKKRVVASIVPLHCMAAHIAEPDAEVRCLLTTKGPHDFQPSPSDAKLISSADLFIANGLRLEDFLESLLRNAGNRKMRIVRTGDLIPKDLLVEASGIPHYHGDQLVVHKGIDPHVWLGVETATIQAEAIRDALIELDPEHAANYRQRADAFLADLRRLKEEAQGLDQLPGGLVTFHDSFRYFGKSFGITIAGAIQGLEGEAIGGAEMRRQIQDFKAKGVRLIGVEPQYPAKVAEELARGIGPEAKTIPLDPLETGPLAPDRAFYVDKNHYLATMRQNLDNLRKAQQKPMP